METEYLGSAIIPSGYNGHTVTAHYCGDAAGDTCYCVWQDGKMTGWFSLPARCVPELTPVFECAQ